MPDATIIEPFADLDAIARSNDLHALEGVISRGKVTFWEVAAALWRVRDAKLYKLTHKSWESWLQTHWWGSKRHADRHIAALRVMRQLGPGVSVSESQARELAKVPEGERGAVLEEAAELRAASGKEGPPSREDLQGAIAARAEPGAKKPKRLQTRRTPLWLFDALSDRFGPFDLDAYASPDNALCPEFITKEQDGNKRPWGRPGQKTFANPPFENLLIVLMQAFAQCSDGREACIIAPAGGSQEWYQEWAIRGTIWVPDCRINYDDPDGNPTGAGLEEPGANRDTTIVTMGGEWWNHPDEAERGLFDCRRLELKHLKPGG
jgi:phage N-6-adenine-methyltransferase